MNSYKKVLPIATIYLPDVCKLPWHTEFWPRIFIMKYHLLYRPLLLIHVGSHVAAPAGGACSEKG